MTRRLTRTKTIAAGVLGTSAAFVAGGLALGGIASQIVERRRNRVHHRGPYVASPRAVELHRTLTVVDLHADSLLWGRDLRRRAGYGHLDVPRLVDGGVALVALAASTQVPRRVNLERNDDRTDDVRLLALGQRWPRATWGSRVARALHLALRLRGMVADSAGRLSLIESRTDLDTYLARRSADHGTTAAFLAIEGAQALDGDLDNLDILFRAGYRMLSPAHFFDTAYGGSAHGIVKGGLTEAGRELLSRMESMGMVMDVAHAASATIDDVLSLAARPVVASHTGVRAAAPGIRNLPDDQARAIAATGGLIGIGFWPVACGGTDVADIARSIVTAVELAGMEHVALGSDFDGAVPTPFDASGMPLLTEALLAEGLSETDIAAVMGGNAVRVLAAALPR
ncbi:MAG TPA: membrane dipeptidase [Candidatus Limnocylindrales bacterium]|nr:membrane dipeptidase [Candidatus Limnocylindrales bacterium]